MKKFLTLFGALVLASSSLTVGFSTIQTSKNINQKENIIKFSDAPLDWNNVSSVVDDFFADSFEQKNDPNVNSFSTDIQEQEMLSISKENSKKYLEKFKNENASVKSIIESLKSEFPEFNESYKNEVKNLYSINSADQKNTHNQEKIQNNTSINNFGYGSSIDKILNVQKLKIKKDWELADILEGTSIGLGVLAAGAAVAAAGFWSGAWFFAISVPWAIGCTTLSVAAGTAGTALGIYSLTIKNDNKKLDENYNKIKENINVPEFVDDLVGMGIDLWGYLKDTFNLIVWSVTAFQAIMAGSSWAFPPVLTISFPLTVILGLVDLLFVY